MSAIRRMNRLMLTLACLSVLAVSAGCSKQKEGTLDSEELQQRLARIEAVLNETRPRANAINTELDNVLAALQHMDAEVSEMGKTFQELTKRLDESANKQNTLTNAVRDTSKGNETLRRQLTRQEAEIRRLNEQVRTLQEAVKRFRGQVR